MFSYRAFALAAAFGLIFTGVAQAAPAKAMRQNDLVTRLTQRGLNQNFKVRNSRTNAVHTITARGVTRADATKLRNAMATELTQMTRAANLGKNAKPTVTVQKQRVQKDYNGLYAARATVTVKVNKSGRSIMNKLEALGERIEAKHDGNIRANHYNRDKAEIYTNVTAVPTEKDKLTATAKATIKMIKRGKALTRLVAPAFKGGGVKGKAGRITNVELDTWRSWWRDGGDFTAYGQFTQEVK